MQVDTVLPPPVVTNAGPPGELTAEQQQLYDKVSGHFSGAKYCIPGVESGAFTENEKFWLSYECILRYLRATKWDADSSITRLEATLKWRRAYGVYTVVTADHVEPEAETGKEILFGYDTHGRPGLYMFPSQQNTTDPLRQVQYAVWMLERSIDLMGAGVENICLLINFADKAKNPSISTARTVLNILQDHYPERLGFALIVKVPFLVATFLKVIMPFVDPVTRAKIKMNPEVVKEGIFTPENVMREWGGETDFVYEHSKYWPELVKLCEKRRQVETERWRALGGTVGLREWDYKQGGSEKVPVEAKA